MASFRIKNDGVFIRHSPSATSDRNLFPPSLALGDIVEQLETSADGIWTRVQIKQGRTKREGWVATRYLILVDPPLETPVPPEEPAWLVLAQEEIGGAESKPDRARIREYLTTTTINIQAKDVTDDTDWNSSFVNWCLTRSGFRGTGDESARSWWNNWKGGTRIDKPREGCIAVFRQLTRGVDRGAGYVGFFMDIDGDQISVLGGDLKGGVAVRLFARKDLIGYLYPNPRPVIIMSAHMLLEAAGEQDTPTIKRLPSRRFYETSLDERQQKIDRLRAQLTNGNAETPAERAQIEQQIKDAESDFSQALARMNYVAQKPIKDASDAGGNSNWRAAWSWVDGNGNGLYIEDPNAPFNDANHRNKPGEAQGSNIERVVAFLSVETTPRYFRQGKNTFCTLFVYDATWLLSVEIPIAPNREADTMLAWLVGTEGQARGWRKLASVEEAQEFANQGFPVVAAQHGIAGEAGHVSLIRPVPLDKLPPHHDAYMAQAGGVLRSLVTVSERFGSPDKVSFFMHS